MRTEIWTDDRGRAWRVALPENRRERARGLLGREALAADEALFLGRCRSVHTLGMRFAIDAVALGADLDVKRVVTLAPRRVSLPVSGARHILEIATGSGLHVGQRFQMSSARSTTLAR
jgi:uncharacterized membrane protein (UPF0127 family)